MRPVARGASPKANEFTDYADAQPYLIARLGNYCSYCERRVVTQLAVEHIQPKGLAKYRHLHGSWTNFLLGCVNCNSTKKDKDVVLSKVLLPDRDNTFAAFSYLPDGRITPSPHAIATGVGDLARALLALTGLDKNASSISNVNGKQVAIDRVTQRLEVWAVAEEALADITAQPEIDAIKTGVIRAALAYGFFSIWMTVFASNIDMRKRLIRAFSGTSESGCFDPESTAPRSPAPNPDGLKSGGKV